MLHFMSQIYSTTRVNLYIRGKLVIWLTPKSLVSVNPLTHPHVRLNMKKIALVLLLKSYMLYIIKEVDIYIWSILLTLNNAAVVFRP